MSRFTVTSLAVLSCILSVNAAKLPSLRIVGGAEAKLGQFPYQVSFEHKGFHTCGGTIIAPNVVLTSAHCTYFRKASDMAIRAGSVIREEGGQHIKVKIFNDHPLFDGVTVYYDVSVLILEKPLVYNCNVKPIKLPEATGEEYPPFATVSGWGEVNNTNHVLPKELRFVSVPIWDMEKCMKYLSLSRRMICAGSDIGVPDNCYGDAGSPLALNGTLIGIASWAYGCSRPPGVYVEVADPIVRNFIKTESGV